MLNRIFRAYQPTSLIYRIANRLFLTIRFFYGDAGSLHTWLMFRLRGMAPSEYASFGHLDAQAEGRYYARAIVSRTQVHSLAQGPNGGMGGMYFPFSDAAHCAEEAQALKAVHNALR